jgi:TnpA family transposase
MPRRSVLSVAEKEKLLAVPDAKDDLIRHYTLSDSDIAIIRQHRGAANLLGFAVQLCYMRYPGVIIGVNEIPAAPLLRFVASQLKMPVEAWTDYGQREQTRREHLVELQKAFGFKIFRTLSHYRLAARILDELAWQTDKGMLLATELGNGLRRERVLLPAVDVIERICAEAITQANRRI